MKQVSNRLIIAAMKKGIFLVFISIFVFGGHLYSQTYLTFYSELQQIKEKARFRLGPFRIDPRIQLRNIGYDDNVYYRSEDEDPISDYTATISPEAKVYLLFRDYLILSLTENPEYVHYFKQSRERRWNHSISPAFRLLLLHRFILGGSYSYQNRRFRVTSEFNARRNLKQEGFKWSLFYETARETSIGVVYQSEKFSYEDIELPEQNIVLSHTLDRNEDQVEMEFYYKIRSESFLFLKWGYTDIRFEGEQAKWRDSYSYQTLTGIRFPLLGRVRGVLSIGYKNLQPRIEGKKGFSGIVGNTDLEYRLRRLSFRAQFNRDSQFSFSSSNVFFVDTSFVGGMSFYLTRSLRLDYSYSYREAHYPEMMPVKLPSGVFEDIKRRDISRMQTIGFVFRLIRTIGIGLNVSLWSRESAYFGAERNRLFIGGYLTYDF